MTKTSNFSLPSFKPIGSRWPGATFALAFALGTGTLCVLGQTALHADETVPTKLKILLKKSAKDGVFTGFDSTGSVLTVVRWQEVPLSGYTRGCAAWKEATLSVPARGGEPTPGWEAWGTFESAELKLIQECDSLPCAVKLDENEVVRITAAPKEKRLARFFELMQARLDEFRATSQRRATEFPGKLMDASEELKARGANAHLQGKDAGWKSIEDTRLRVLPFDSGEKKTIRQIMHWKRGERPDDAYVLGQDVYTNHYFDAWGEYLDLRCLAATGEGGARAQVLQALLIDLDLLKKNDLFSRLGRPKMRDGVEKEGYRYLDRIFEELAARARELSAKPTVIPATESPKEPLPTPTPSGAPSGRAPSGDQADSEPSLPFLEPSASR